MKGYQRKEKRLTKKVEELEHKLNKEGTSRFGTGKLLSNLAPEEIELSMGELSYKQGKNSLAKLNNGSTPAGYLGEDHNSIPSDLTMQSIDSLEELMVSNPTTSN
jgi:hypothetical protein